MDPKEKVVARRNESLMAPLQKLDASCGVNHQVPMTPATVT